MLEILLYVSTFFQDVVFLHDMTCSHVMLYYLCSQTLSASHSLRRQLKYVCPVIEEAYMLYLTNFCEIFLGLKIILVDM